MSLVLRVAVQLQLQQTTGFPCDVHQVQQACYSTQHWFADSWHLITTTTTHKAKAYFDEFQRLGVQERIPVSCVSISCTVEEPVKKHDNVVNGTLSGPSSRVIRGKLLVPVSTFLQCNNHTKLIWCCRLLSGCPLSIVRLLGYIALKHFFEAKLISMLHFLIARRRVGPQWRPRHKAFTSRLGLDAKSLFWPTVVRLVVSFNSGLQWGISQEYSSLFRHSGRFDFVFSLRCIDWVRKPLCEPNFLCIFYIKNYIGT